MGRAADWLREERRKVLGDWAAFCVECGGAQRWFEQYEDQLPTECPACGGELLHRCRAENRITVTVSSSVTSRL